MRIQHYIAAFIIFCSSSCSSPKNPYVDRATIDALIKSQNPEVNHVVLVYNNDVYYFDNLAKEGVRVTKNPEISKTQVKISHDHKKIAYQTGYGSIVIVDLSGTVLAELTDHERSKSFDWSADDKTLYMLIGNRLAYYGPAMNLPEFTFDKYYVGEVISASVSMKGDLAYTIRVFDFERGTRYLMIVKKADKSKDLVFEDVSSLYRMSYVSFSVNNQDLLLGFAQDNQRPERLNSLYVFIDFVKSSQYGFGSTTGFLTPVFNESQSWLVASTPRVFEGSIMPAAIGVNKLQDKTVVNRNYTTTDTPLYTDWK